MRFFSMKFLFLSWLPLSPLVGGEIALKEPPKGWECIQDASQLPQKVKIIYLGDAQGINGFTPSLNVACESTPLSLDDYVKLAINYHEGQKDTRCLLLGKIKTQSGDAHLIQIDRPSQWGDIRFLQAMLIHKQEAYVVTATFLKKDFGAYSTAILKAIQSVTIDFK